jgi:carotenoid 1,2-hydratase
VTLDPDRFFQFPTPGAQEWWYFDAISDDGAYALVVVWYAGLPFDPDYGLATLRHLKNPGRYPAPNALDHAAIGLSLYYHGKTVAYALNRYPAGRFEHTAEPFSLAVGNSRIDRDQGGYRLQVDTPAQDGRSMIRADLNFVPAGGTESLERNLGGKGGAPHWILAAADCRVEATIALEGKGGFELKFQGRGYHDHNAGEEEISVAWTRWRWGRVHVGSRTVIYYQAEPRDGREQSIQIVCEDGRPVDVRDDVSLQLDEPRRHPLGIRYARSMSIEGSVPPISRTHRELVDFGPFYLRWLSDFTVGDRTEVGISELLEARSLHKPWFNWMIPYRVKQPTR